MMQVTVKPNTYIFLVLLLFFVPMPWLAAWMLAVFFHEFCHWIAVRLCGGEIHQLSIGLGGANMQSSALTDGKRLFSVLSGPVGGLVLVFVGRWFPRVAICSWLLSVYNLLPLLPLDGGHALQIMLRNEKPFFIAEKFFLAFLTMGAVYASFFLHLGALPLVVVSVLWLKNRKRPCKEGVCKVQ